MKEKLMVCINNIEEVKCLKSLGINTFLFALKDYSIGHNDFEIKDIPKDVNAYILINRVLECKDIDKLEILLKTIPKYIKGIVYEDLGVLQLALELKLDVEMIWYQNHFGVNSEIINFYLDNGNNSAVISNEITKEEIETICNNAKKSLMVQIFGYNQIMYSRRLLLSNYQEFYELDKNVQEVLKEEKSDLTFKAFENKFGTVFVNSKVYNGCDLLNLSNIKFFYIDLSFIDNGEEIVKKILNNDYDFSSLGIECDNGFLTRKTIYKLKERVE